MGERLALALVLLIAVSSIAGILFLPGTSTGAATLECSKIRCPGNTMAQPLLDQNGLIIYADNARPVCMCQKQQAVNS
jgi:hypothetical protein